MLRETYNALVADTLRACRQAYGDRLVSFAVYGSVARGTMRPDSDIDLLLVIDGLPDGRMPRMREFDAVDKAMEAVLQNAASQGIHASLSPIFKTPNEVERGSPLFLDMTDQALILYDRQHFLCRYLEDLSRRLAELGAKRVYRGGGYYWLLKPDLQPGEEIRL